MAAKLTTREVPPELTNGSVMPVTGSRLTTTPMLMNAWNAIDAVMPTASSPPNVSGADREMRSPRYAKNRNRPMTVTPPMSPSSWPTIANT